MAELEDVDAVVAGDSEGDMDMKKRVHIIVLIMEEIII